MNSKTCDILKRAMQDSRVPTKTAIIKSAARYASVEYQNPIKCIGINKAAIKDSKITILIPAAHVISAKSWPELSKIITSCIIVNSRCVVGSSTGTRQHSVRSITTSARTASNVIRIPSPPAFSKIIERLWKV